MNKIQQFLAITGSAIIIASCQDANSETDVAVNNMATEQSVADTVPAPRYIDLNTGQPIDLYYDVKKNRVYSVVTNEPIDFYIDMDTGDTIYGVGRYVVNNYIVKSPEGPYKLDMSKVKMDKNEMKIKDGNKKLKMDKSNMKSKDGDGKMKMEK